MATYYVHLFRRWLRKKRGVSRIAGPHDQGYLDTMPWLTQFIPLWKQLGSKDQGISFSTMEQFVLCPDENIYHVAYLVRRNGEVLGIARSWLFQQVYSNFVANALRRLGPQAEDVAYMVATFKGFGRQFGIRIFKFPKNAPRLAHLEDLIRTKYQRDHPAEVQAARAALETRSAAREEASAKLA